MRVKPIFKLTEILKLFVVSMWMRLLAGTFAIHHRHALSVWCLEFFFCCIASCDGASAATCTCNILRMWLKTISHSLRGSHLFYSCVPIIAFFSLSFLFGVCYPCLWRHHRVRVCTIGNVPFHGRIARRMTASLHSKKTGMHFWTQRLSHLEGSSDGVRATLRDLLRCVQEMILIYPCCTRQTDGDLAHVCDLRWLCQISSQQLHLVVLHLVMSKFWCQSHRGTT